MIVITVALIGFCVGYVNQVGDEYSMHTHYFVSETAFKGVSIEYGTDGIVESTGHELIDGELVVHFRSLKPGDTSVDIVLCYDELPDNVEETRINHYSELSVSPQGVIIESLLGYVDIHIYTAAVRSI